MNDRMRKLAGILEEGQDKKLNQHIKRIELFSKELKQAYDGWDRGLELPEPGMGRSNYLNDLWSAVRGLQKELSAFEKFKGKI